MASFHTKTFTKHDDYMTPFYAWRNIAHLIPKGQVLWEAFWGNGDSGSHLEQLGFKVIHEDIDFFKHDKGDIVVSNPPFTKSKEVLERLVQLDKPFILIMPLSKINTQYVRNLFKDTKDKLQIIIPRKRIHFQKMVDGKVIENFKSVCNFDCFYYCWKIGLDRDIIWLDDKPPAHYIETGRRYEEQPDGTMKVFVSKMKFKDI
jgi:hypothetical protein